MTSNTETQPGLSTEATLEQKTEIVFTAEDYARQNLSEPAPDEDTESALVRDLIQHTAESYPEATITEPTDYQNETINIINEEGHWVARSKEGDKDITEEIIATGNAELIDDHMALLASLKEDETTFHSFQNTANQDINTATTKDFQINQNIIYLDAYRLEQSLENPNEKIIHIRALQITENEEPELEFLHEETEETLFKSFLDDETIELNEHDTQDQLIIPHITQLQVKESYTEIVIEKKSDVHSFDSFFSQTVPAVTEESEYNFIFQNIDTETNTQEPVTNTTEFSFTASLLGDETETQSSRKEEVTVLDVLLQSFNEDNNDIYADGQAHSVKTERALQDTPPQTIKQAKETTVQETDSRTYPLEHSQPTDAQSKTEAKIITTATLKTTDRLTTNLEMSTTVSEQESPQDTHEDETPAKETTFIPAIHEPKSPQESIPQTIHLEKIKDTPTVDKVPALEVRSDNNENHTAFKNTITRKELAPNIISIINTEDKHRTEDASQEVPKATIKPIEKVTKELSTIDQTEITSRPSSKVEQSIILSEDAPITETPVDRVLDHNTDLPEPIINIKPLTAVTQSVPTPRLSENHHANSEKFVPETPDQKQHQTSNMTEAITKPAHRESIVSPMYNEEQPANLNGEEMQKETPITQLAKQEINPRELPRENNLRIEFINAKPTPTKINNESPIQIINQSESASTDVKDQTIELDIPTIETPVVHIIEHTSVEQPIKAPAISIKIQTATTSADIHIRTEEKTMMHPRETTDLASVTNPDSNTQWYGSTKHSHAVSRSKIVTLRKLANLYRTTGTVTASAQQPTDRTAEPASTTDNFSILQSLPLAA